MAAFAPSFICHTAAAPRNLLYQRLHRAGAQERRRAARRADTNIVAVKFNTLTEPSHMHTGDAVRCQTCSSVLSHFSKLTDRAPAAEGGDEASAGKVGAYILAGSLLGINAANYAIRSIGNFVSYSQHHACAVL